MRDLPISYHLSALKNRTTSEFGPLWAFLVRILSCSGMRFSVKLENNINGVLLSMNPEREIDRFKRHINLSEYAASEGYLIDAHESTRSSVIMRGPDDDKVVITVNRHNNHWIYFSVRDDHDNGTIIDFVQHRHRCDLAHTRKLLRPWMGENPHPTKRYAHHRYAEQVIPVSKDIARVIAEFSAMSPVAGDHRYLVEERCIPVSVLTHPRFVDKIRVDKYHNAVFPHYNASGLCGYEIKNHDYTGFSRGGQKGMWASKPGPDDHTLIIVESAIDALSYETLHHPKRARYISVSGRLSPEQPKLIQSAIRRLPSRAYLMIATDHDSGGDELASSIRACVESSGHLNVTIKEHRPPHQNDDWNDVLKAVTPLP